MTYRTAPLSYAARRTFVYSGGGRSLIGEPELAQHGNGGDPLLAASLEHRHAERPLVGRVVARIPAEIAERLAREKTSRRKPGRPRKYGQGRINATIRFTPERYAELRAEADQNGRSVSEQVEHIVENAARDRETITDLRRQTEFINDQGLENVRAVTEHAVEQMDKLRTVHAAELKRLKAAAHAIEEKRLAEIVEAAVMRALAKPR